MKFALLCPKVVLDDPEGLGRARARQHRRHISRELRAFLRARQTPPPIHLEDGLLAEIQPGRSGFRATILSTFQV
jgi:hypothetical protein